MRAVRERFGDDVLLQVDANTAYTLRDARHLAKLDDFDLLLIEQPLEEEDVLGHAELASIVAHADLPRRVDHVGPDRRRRDPRSARRRSSTSSPAASAATSRRAASTTSPSRTASPVWCGGMLETGIGRAANVALASLPGFTLPGDVSASGPLLPRPTSPSRSSCATVTSTCPPGPAWASSPTTAILESLHDRGSERVPI